MTLLYWNKGISDETRRKLRALAPAGWIPPHDDYRAVTMGESGIVGQSHLEDSEEIAKIMRKRPRGRVRFRANS